jgi:hypothetical protein
MKRISEGRPVSTVRNDAEAVKRAEKILTEVKEGGNNYDGKTIDKMLGSIAELKGAQKHRYEFGNAPNRVATPPPAIDRLENELEKARHEEKVLAELNIAAAKAAEQEALDAARDKRIFEVMKFLYGVRGNIKWITKDAHIDTLLAKVSDCEKSLKHGEHTADVKLAIAVLRSDLNNARQMLALKKLTPRSRPRHYDADILTKPPLPKAPAKNEKKDKCHCEEQ